MGPFTKYVAQGGWIVFVIFVMMRYEKCERGGGLNEVPYVTQRKKLKTHSLIVGVQKMNRAVCALMFPSA